MVRHYKRKTARASYSSEALENALDEVNRGCLTLHQAAAKYEIPYSTLQSRRNGRRGKSSSQGRTTAIPKEQEKKLAEGLITMEKWGFGLTRKEVINIVAEFVKRNNLKTPFKDGVPGEDWFISFKNRYKLSLKKPQALEYARKKAQMDPFIIETYFDILGNTIEELKLSNKPNQIFNIDETSFALDPSKTKVVGLRNAPSSRVTAGPGRESTTLLLGGNAAGEKLPPLIVYKGKNMWDTWMAPQQSSSNFTWPENRDVTAVDASDIITAIPELALGRHGDLSFPVAFHHNLH